MEGALWSMGVVVDEGCDVGKVLSWKEIELM